MHTQRSNTTHEHACVNTLAQADTHTHTHAYENTYTCTHAHTHACTHIHTLVLPITQKEEGEGKNRTGSSPTIWFMAPSAFETRVKT